MRLSDEKIEEEAIEKEGRVNECFMLGRIGLLARRRRDIGLCVLGRSDPEVDCPARNL
jgi:hypothetical protein